MNVILVLLFAIGLAADQWSKFEAINSLKGIGGRTIINGIVRFTYVENSGAAFGWLKNARLILIFTSFAAIAAVFYILFGKRITHPLGQTALTLIAAGAAGNLIDRVRLGFVVDFIELLFVKFAVFNIADCLITAGVILLAVYMMFFQGGKES